MLDLKTGFIEYSINVFCNVSVQYLPYLISLACSLLGLEIFLKNLQRTATQRCISCLTFYLNLQC